MFQELRVPYDSVMLFNMAKLKQGIDFDEFEQAMAEVCNFVHNAMENEDDGFIAGQVLRFAADMYDGVPQPKLPEDRDRVMIIMYWKSYEHHEKAHRNPIFRERFMKLLDYCESMHEFGYDIMWQGPVRPPEPTGWQRFANLLKSFRKS